MLTYRFAMHDNGAGIEDLGGMALDDDGDALAFAGRVIRDIMYKGAKKHAGWTMNITEDNRVVGTIPFDAAHGAKE
jgi:hypothetical protein